MIVNREPVLISEAIKAILLLLMGFGVVHVTTEQLASVMLAVTAVLAFVVRSRVSPVA